MTLKSRASVNLREPARLRLPTCLPFRVSLYTSPNLRRHTSSRDWLRVAYELLATYYSPPLLRLFFAFKAFICAVARCASGVTSLFFHVRSEERRVGSDCVCGW